MKYYAGIGSRETPRDVCQLMTLYADYLRRHDYTLRSGHAEGADQAFERGAGTQKQIFIPWRGFAGSNSQYDTITRDALSLAQRFHPAWDRCSEQARKLHARNCYQILGPSLTDPVDFVVCWTHDGRASGGTGQALRIAASYGIPVVNFYYAADRERILDTIGAE